MMMGSGGVEDTTLAEGLSETVSSAYMSPSQDLILGITRAYADVEKEFYRIIKTTRTTWEGEVYADYTLTLSKLLKKHGWTEGTGLGVAQQGRLEPVPAYIKKNKRGLGAEKSKKTVEHPKSSRHSSGKKIVNDGEKETECGVQKKKGMSKKMKKVLELEKRMQEQEFERAFFREFWPDNV